MKALSGILAVCLVLAGAVFVLTPTPAEARFRMDSNGYSYGYSWSHGQDQQSETEVPATSDAQDTGADTQFGPRGPYGLQDGTCDPEQPQDGTGFGFKGGR